MLGRPVDLGRRAVADAVDEVGELGCERFAPVLEERDLDHARLAVAGALVG